MQRHCTLLFVVTCSLYCQVSPAADPAGEGANAQQAAKVVEKKGNAASSQNAAKQQQKGEPNAGEEDLFEATQRKVNSQSFGDLKEVILLCEAAIRKGLDPQNQQFARQLIASTRFERASRICEEIFDRYPPSDNWPTLSQLARVDLEAAVKQQAPFAEANLLLGRIYCVNLSGNSF